ncbi:DUF2892 domain-containing protein [Variovorax sp. N23]|uniref:YgaP family membrane protein n=1 Tax=Variovorax sp. N23 TaxID=2980555 RepID=UPI0021C8F1B5|nr:DUF2892 domain-containing protein [Variovorax sp. N23]MCU4117702.1 DUF2892 domain-containing protein [Variovorax sp. N23]
MPFLVQNLGFLDCAVRLAMGVWLIALADLGTIGLWGYIGVMLLLSGTIGSCPAYSLLGFSTRDGASR